MKCDILYKGVPIRVQEVIITTDLYALPLMGPNIVLEVQWLEGFGQVIFDYGKGTMQLKWGDGLARLRTGMETPKKEVMLKSIEHMWKQGAQCYAI